MGVPGAGLELVFFVGEVAVGGGGGGGGGFVVFGIGGLGFRLVGFRFGLGLGRGVSWRLGRASSRLGLGVALDFLFGFPAPFLVDEGVLGVCVGVAQPFAVPGEGPTMVFSARVAGCCRGAADKVAGFCQVGEGVGLDLGGVELCVCHFWCCEL